MKINDKHLAAFATSDSRIDKEGYLHKKGEVNKAYQRRYFVLKGNLLYYFERQTDKEPIGVIVLEECTVEVAEGNTDGNSFELVFPGVGSRHYVLSAETQETMESWMRAITCANYEYTRLLVSELQRQLDELNLEQAASQAHQSGKAVSVVNQNSSGKGRQNPFNLSNEFDNGPKAGTSRPVSSASTDSQKMRTFEELHFEFGNYICKKVEEFHKSKEEKAAE